MVIGEYYNLKSICLSKTIFLNFYVLQYILRSPTGRECRDGWWKESVGATPGGWF